MVTFLTIYFWFFTALGFIGWAQGLVKKPQVKPVLDKPMQESERVVTQGCVMLTVAPLAALLFAPMTYLQVVGLNDVGLPGWVAWLSFGLNLLGALFILTKKETVSGGGSSLFLVGYLLAWHGLQVLSQP